MKQFFKNIVLFSMFILANQMYGGLVIGSEMLFNSSYTYDELNEVNTGGFDAWKGSGTGLYVGLYPILNDKNIKGRVKLFVNASNSTSIFVGGAKISGFNDDKSFLATAFYLEPSITMSDPMGSGRRFMSDVYTTPIANSIFFSDPEHQSFYPYVANETGNTNTWFNGNNNALGGRNSIGLYTTAKILGGFLTLEDFVSYNLHNFDSYGASLKAKQIELGPVKLDIGLIADLMTFKKTHNFSEYNNYNLYDMNRRLPQQTKSQGRYFAWGEYFDANILDLFNVFGELKLQNTKGSTMNSDINTNVISGLQLYAGVYTKAIDGSIIELSFGLISDRNLDKSSDPEVVIATRNLMEIKLKTQGGFDLDFSGMKIFYTLDATFINGSDNINPYKSYENVNFGSTMLSNISGIDVKGSLKYELFYMFALRELARFNTASFSGGGSTDIMQIESRTYFDVDLEDVTSGLWLTAGLRFDYMSLTSDTLTTVGSYSYLTPYGEIKYIFGEQSYAKISWGVPEDYSDIANAYGIQYDAYKLQNSDLGVGGTTGTLYNKAAYLLNNNYGLQLSVGLKL